MLPRLFFGEYRIFDFHDLLFDPGYQPRCGVVSAFSTDHPRMVSLCDKASGKRPISRAHCDEFWVRPSNVMRLFERLLLFWVAQSAQTQFSKEYDPSLSFRSSVCSVLGRGPISRRNTSKSFHRGSQSMPLPPYLEYDFAFGLLQRVRMLAQTLYSVVLANPCVVALCVLASRITQVHRFERVMRRLPFKIFQCLPHSHLHSHRPFVSDGWMTVSGPKTMPLRFSIELPYPTWSVTSSKEGACA
jgi:hypothetical protein